MVVSTSNCPNFSDIYSILLRESLHLFLSHLLATPQVDLLELNNSKRWKKDSCFDSQLSFGHSESVPLKNIQWEILDHIWRVEGFMCSDHLSTSTPDNIEHAGSHLAWMSLTHREQKAKEPKASGHNPPILITAQTDLPNQTADNCILSHPKVTLKADNGVLAWKRGNHWSRQEEQRICLWPGEEIGISQSHSKAYKRYPLKKHVLLMVRCFWKGPSYLFLVE